MTKSKYLEAFALGFSGSEDSAPVLTARGELDLAAHMVAIAKRYGIPVVEEPALCDALAPLPIDQQIPSELFEAAAAIMVEVGALVRKRA